MGGESFGLRGARVVGRCRAIRSICRQWRGQRRADLAQDLGTLVRTPQTGRVRMYVTVLMVAVALGLAATVILVLSK